MKLLTLPQKRTSHYSPTCEKCCFEVAVCFLLDRAVLSFLRCTRLQLCLLPSSSIPPTSKRQRASKYRFLLVLLDWRHALAANLCAQYLTQLLHSSWDSSVLCSQLFWLFESLRSPSCPPISSQETPKLLLIDFCLSANYGIIVYPMQIQIAYIAFRRAVNW